jgi:uncharacterized repeat protein (TIGR03803 family)
MKRKFSRNYSLSVVAPFIAAGPRFGSTKLAAAAIRGALTLAVLFALLLIAARPAHAQTETVLYNFTGGSDGGTPQSRLTFDAAGNLYGTTYGGGLGYGTVFELSPNGNGGWNETVLYSFTGGADGANPMYSYVVFDSAGNLYGTARNGGANGLGVVFELSPVGTSWTETVVYSFAGGWDGAYPWDGLIMDPAGNLYGTNPISVGYGAVFELSPSGGWTKQGIYFPGSGTASPMGLTMDAAGNIFGITNSQFYDSTVFELSPNGNGGWNPTVIYTFRANGTGQYPNGEDPFGTLVLDQAGNIYGTTLEGGAYNEGTVYLLSWYGYWYQEVLHSFAACGPKDGCGPWGGVVRDPAGDIYGTTSGGGSGPHGTVFELVYGRKEKILWNFHGTDGAFPRASLILDSAGNLYGTASEGGLHNAGVVFKMTVATTTTLTSSPNPSMYGQAVTFTAVVTSGGGVPPDGETVSFMKGTTVLGTGSLSGGSASFTTSVLPAGKMLVRAVYGGDTTFAASTSKAVTQVVNKYPTTTALSSSLNPSNYGQAVTFTATVTPTEPYQPTGKVIFKNGSKTLAVGTLNASGVASLTTAKIPVGANTLTATYNGDAFNSSSESAAITQTVSQASVSIVLTSTPNPSTFGKSVKFTATLTSNGGVPSGQPVTFSYNGATLGTANVNSKGVATFSTTTLPQGSDDVTAAYAGTVDYSSASASVTQLVN